jgi:hypothetical protein
LSSGAGEQETAGERLCLSPGHLLQALLLYFFAAERQKNRGDRRWTFPNDDSGTGIFWLAVSQAVPFTADTFFRVDDFDRAR